ncbi:3-oxoacyl-[acyl-carrier-protein] synthase III C-terminal domain-containing protein [Streptomyces lonegramiae]|uniref:3-oxoacyl-[acyl-carrier-protein] synthase III C-terminal domain-containing protein n=1 Tax=Streptomyces lonegramiae TaxID=3075524 RepID=A0ABU2XBI2_9ACTN|nr:3-oxoacyl-[acyl-carrier-protein] synthase III C-terminal domain-containing protein [Streptomyces sp. DSM 41529]MDT0543278.1 3-oxoacyl-[acyl-carrier-protein] synthase III C-terminal domain-containing protein [Streptomyces sp. DSM 41529]
MRLGPIGTFVPHTALTVADVTAEAGLPDAKARFYRDYLGFRDIPRSPGHSLADMLTAAGREALSGTDPRGVRQVLYARIGEDADPAGDDPTGAQLLDGVRTALGLDHAPAFSVGQMNCAAGLFALFLAEQLLAPAEGARRCRKGERAEALRNEGSSTVDRRQGLRRPGGDLSPQKDDSGSVLLLTGDRVARPRQGVIPGIAVVADAAAACVVGPQVPGDRLLGSAFRTYGRFYRSLGGADPDREREYTRFYAPALAAVIEEALGEAGTGLDGVRWIVPHNVNRLSWKGVAKELGIPFSQVFLDNLPRLGHANCSDPYLNLASLRASGRLGPGDTYVLATVGLGATFGAAVLERGDERCDERENGRGSEREYEPGNGRGRSHGEL